MDGVFGAVTMCDVSQEVSSFPVTELAVLGNRQCWEVGRRLELGPGLDMARGGSRRFGQAPSPFRLASCHTYPGRFDARRPRTSAGPVATPGCCRLRDSAGAAKGSTRVSSGRFETTDLIERIRAYQSENAELLRSHHFVFDCPLDQQYTRKPRFVWIGVNPGSDCDDWMRLPENTEESRDYDFQIEHGRSEGSANRLSNLRHFVGENVFCRMTHSQWFFWGSKDATKSFKARYEYSLRNNPHWAFCCGMNRSLIERARPLAVLAEGRWIARLNACRLGLQKVCDHKHADGDTLIEEWVFDGELPLYAFDHLSALGKSIPLRPALRERLAALLGDGG